MTWVVTGANGGIGQAVMEELRVRQIDSLPVTRALGNYAKAYPGATHLVHCAGREALGSLARLTREGLLEVLESNLFTAVDAVQAARRSGCSSVLVVGSLAASQPWPGIAAYSMAKSALRGLVLTAAKEFSPMRVNLLEPAGVLTAMHERVATRIDVKGYEARHPLGLIAPSSAAKLAVEIALNPSMTGAIVPISAGLGL